MLPDQMFEDATGTDNRGQFVEVVKIKNKQTLSGLK